MPFCAVYGCDSHSKKDKNYKFHGLPASGEIRERWLSLLGRPLETLPLTAVVCSKHFEPRCFTSRGTSQVLSRNAVPMLFLPVAENDGAVKDEVCDPSIAACRACLATDARLYDIIGTEMEYAFLKITGVSLSTPGGLPSRLCSFCCAELSKCTSFRDRCHRAQLILKSLREWGPLNMSDISTIDRHSHKLALHLTLTGVRTFDLDENNVLPAPMMKIEVDNGKIIIDGAKFLKTDRQFTDCDDEVEIKIENCDDETDESNVESDPTKHKSFDFTKFLISDEKITDFDDEVEIKTEIRDDEIDKSNLDLSDLKIKHKLVDVSKLFNADEKITDFDDELEIKIENRGNEIDECNDLISDLIAIQKIYEGHDVAVFTKDNFVALRGVNCGVGINESKEEIGELIEKEDAFSSFTVVSNKSTKDDDIIKTEYSDEVDTKLDDGEPDERINKQITKRKIGNKQLNERKKKKFAKSEITDLSILIP